MYINFIAILISFFGINNQVAGTHLNFSNDTFDFSQLRHTPNRPLFDWSPSARAPNSTHLEPNNTNYPHVIDARTHLEQIREIARKNRKRKNGPQRKRARKNRKNGGRKRGRKLPKNATRRNFDWDATTERSRNEINPYLPPLSSIYPPTSNSTTSGDSRNETNEISDPILDQLSFLEKQLKEFENQPLVPDQSNSIVDQNSCEINRGGCDHICVDGSPIKCLCYRGFQLGPNGRRCHDIDECANTTTCSHTCRNVPGSYYCTCPTGYRLSSFDRQSCIDINECLLRNGHGPCEDICTNTLGSFKCLCNGPGAHLGTDGRSCVRGEGACSKCSHTCVHARARGVAFCTCPTGMYLGKDDRTCEDINECADTDISSSCEYGCVNTPGSYHCAPKPIRKDQQLLTMKPIRLVAPDHIVCRPLFPPRRGYLECKRDKVAFTEQSAHRKYLLRNRPGTACVLVCPENYYRKQGDYDRVCNVNGQWIGPDNGICIPHPRPTIVCPSKIDTKVSRSVRNIDGSKATLVLPKPKLSSGLIYERDVTTVPVDAKRRIVTFGPGAHWIKYTATHPLSKRSASCTMIVIVNPEQT